MNILGFDTCFESCSVAVACGVAAPGVPPSIEARFADMATGQAERLMPMIEDAMAAARLRFADLDRIAVTIGPGTFTGMRIGVAAARAFSLALGIPVVTFSSLEVMAMSPRLRSPRGGDIVLAADARRDQVYVQVVTPGTALHLGEPQLLPIGEAARIGGTGPLEVAGKGAELVAAEARRQGRESTAMLQDLQPRMEDALASAGVKPPAASAPRPLYLRPPDAKPQADKSLARTQ